jgi:uncharacterized membrane protein required for colicin V production
MTWFDVVAFLLVVLIAWLESKRGFGRALFDFVGGIISLRLAIFLAEPLSESLPVFRRSESCEAFWLATVFVALAVLVVVGSKLVYETTLVSLDVLDPLVGGIIGTASGLMVAHLVLRTLLVSYGQEEIAKLLLQSFAGQELLQLRSYRTTLAALHNLGRW